MNADPCSKFYCLPSSKILKVLNDFGGALPEYMILTTKLGTVILIVIWIQTFVGSGEPLIPSISLVVRFGADSKGWRLLTTGWPYLSELVKGYILNQDWCTCMRRTHPYMLPSYWTFATNFVSKSRDLTSFFHPGFL